MRRRRRSAGFTLIETIVAFSIAATSVALLFRIHASASMTVTLTEEYAYATELARSLLTEQSVTERTPSFSRRGVALGKFHWRVVGEIYRDAAAEFEQGPPPSWALREIAVEVEWRAKDKERRISLRTVKPFVVSVDE